MAALMPVSGSFNEYASRFVDPALGFSMGFNYWFSWALTLPIEMAAVSLAMGYWFTLPGWIWSALTLVICTSVNLFGVKSFGDAEYVFSIVKIVAILLFIMTGIAFSILSGDVFANWRHEEAPFVNGVFGIFQVFLTAFFSYGGTELVGITGKMHFTIAGEAKNPSVVVPKAIKGGVNLITGTFYRILIFYTGALFILGLIVPYDIQELGSEGVSTSAFTLALFRMKIPYADHILNAVGELNIKLKLL